LERSGARALHPLPDLIGEFKRALAIHLDKENFQMQMKLTKNIGMLLLGAWLILSGLMPLLNFGFSGLGMIMAVLALAAGVLILLGR
jgi:hypothetical protein